MHHTKCQFREIPNENLKFSLQFYISSQSVMREEITLFCWEVDLLLHFCNLKH